MVGHTFSIFILSDYHIQNLDAITSNLTRIILGLFFFLRLFAYTEETEVTVIKTGTAIGPAGSSSSIWSA